MSSGPYPPMLRASTFDPESAPVAGIQLAGWHWPLRLFVDTAAEPGRPVATIKCGRGLCGTVLLELSAQTLEHGWAFDPAELSEYAAVHLIECKSGTVRRIL